jgi:hypothetical protein
MLPNTTTSAALAFGWAGPPATGSTPRTLSKFAPHHSFR